MNARITDYNLPINVFHRIQAIMEPNSHKKRENVTFPVVETSTVPGFYISNCFGLTMKVCQPFKCPIEGHDQYLEDAFFFSVHDVVKALLQKEPELKNMKITRGFDLLSILNKVPGLKKPIIVSDEEWCENIVINWSEDRTTINLFRSIKKSIEKDLATKNIKVSKSDAKTAVVVANEFDPRHRREMFAHPDMFLCLVSYVSPIFASKNKNSH
jgi:hypothetical protein